MNREDFEMYRNMQMGGLGNGCGPTLIYGILLFVLICFASCRTVKHNTTEREQTDDSVRIEYREKIVKVPVTVYVEVPVERQVRMDRDSSHLETTFAVSEAKMVWIDGVLFLRHSLENKPQKIARTDSVPVVEKEKIMWKTRRVTYTKTEIREKKLSWWEKVKLLFGGWAMLACALLVGVLAWRLRPMFTRLV